MDSSTTIPISTSQSSMYPTKKIHEKEREIVSLRNKIEEKDKIIMGQRQERTALLVKIASDPSEYDKLLPLITRSEDNSKSTVADYLKLRENEKKELRRWRTTVLDLLNEEGEKKEQVIKFLQDKTRETNLLSVTTVALQISDWPADKLISRSQITKLSDTPIGSGSFGQVYRGLIFGNIPVAIKELRQAPKGDIFHQSLHSSSGSGSQAASVGMEPSVKAFSAECKLLSSFKNDFILKFYGACFEAGMNGEQPYYCLVTELANGSLADILYAPSKRFGIITTQFSLSFSRKLKIIEQIAIGMRYLHDKGVFHLDLKPANILLDENHNVRIADFGFSLIDSENILKNSVKGTPYYMAPELLLIASDKPSKSAKLHTACDIYSFGILMNELILEEKPYETMNVNTFTKLKEIVTSGDVPGVNRPCLKDTEKTDEPGRILNEIIVRCWASDSMIRPGFPFILKEAPWARIIKLSIETNEKKARQLLKVYKPKGGNLLTEIKYENFLEKFRGVYHLEGHLSINYKPFQIMFGVQNTSAGKVELRKAKAVLSWFHDVPGTEIIRLMGALLDHDWFFHFKTPEEVNALFNKYPNNQKNHYLVYYFLDQSKFIFAYSMRKDANNYTVMTEPMESILYTDLKKEVKQKVKKLKLKYKKCAEPRPKELCLNSITRKFNEQVPKYTATSQISKPVYD